MNAFEESFGPHKAPIAQRRDPGSECMEPLALRTYRLERALKKMAQSGHLAPCAVAAGAHKSLATAKLFPSEIKAIGAASSSRLAAFRSGRACVRTALAKLNVPPVSIPIDAAGGPVWPNGLVGSISHADGIAVAVVASNPPVQGLGIDIEVDAPLDDGNLVALICRPDERVSKCDLGHPANLRHGKLLFCIKEAVYKLYRPFTNAFLDFHDVWITLDKAAGVFRAELVNPQVPAIMGCRSISGRFMYQDGIVSAIAGRR
jgi:4'-phosphopantetheinyl transferase EntD